MKYAGMVYEVVVGETENIAVRHTWLIGAPDLQVAVAKAATELKRNFGHDYEVISVRTLGELTT